MTPETIQLIVTGVLSGGLVSGLISLISKRSRSPESQNELARIGNEFASKLLEDARTERKELRETISELEQTRNIKQDTIDRLQDLVDEKDRRINELESRRRIVARKIRDGELVTLADIFGEDAPDITVVLDVFEDTNEVA